MRIDEVIQVLGCFGGLCEQYTFSVGAFLAFEDACTQGFSGRAKFVDC